MKAPVRKHPKPPRAAPSAQAQMRILPMLICALITAALTSLAFSITERSGRSNQSPAPFSSITPSTDGISLVNHLLAAPSIATSIDVALLNLACFPDSQGANISQYMRTLDQWAAVVSEQTNKNLHRFHERPGDFANEAEWRLAMMVTVLGQDFKLGYDPKLTSTTRQNASNKEFFSNPESVFISGCLGPLRIGTCASLPVLYVAIGRRIGYPMHLVTAKGHLFARWDDGKGTRVNLEAANAGGYVSHPDSHYRNWPFPIRPEEEKAGRYLQNLDPNEILAVFLSTRAACLESTGDKIGAIAAASAAYRLSPRLGGIYDALSVAVMGASNTRPRELEELVLFQQMAHHQRSASLHPSPIPGTYPGLPQGQPAASAWPASQGPGFVPPAGTGILPNHFQPSGAPVPLPRPH